MDIYYIYVDIHMYSVYTPYSELVNKEGHTHAYKK